MKIKKRIEWVDRLKAICMMLVIIGHFDFYPSNIAKIYAPFMLSGFLFASGYTFHLEENFIIFFIKKLRTLLFPMLWMGLLTIFSRSIVSFNRHQSINQQLLDFFIQIRGRNDELWFLACLFGSSIIFYLIISFIKDNKWIVLITFFMSLIGIVYTKLGGESLPWHIHMYGSSCFILALGYVYSSEYESYTQKLVSKKNFFIAMIIYLIVIFIDYKIFNSYGISFNTYGNSIIMFYLVILSSLSMIILFVKNLCDSKILQFIGINTLLYYGLHGKILSLLTVIFSKIGIIRDSDVNHFIVALLGLAIACIILWPISYMVNKWLPFLLGKKKKKQ